MAEPAALSIATLVLRAKQLEIAAAHQLARRADLVDAIGQLIHALQRERGASSIWLASAGTRFGDERTALVAECRQAQARVRDAFAQHAEAAQGATARSLSLMAWALLGLEAMDALREQIARRAMQAHDLVATFSHLIAGLIELVLLAADAADVPSVSRQLVALLHLVQAQEEAGQERAVGALLYASGQGSETHQQRVLHLIEAQERSLAVFDDFADASLRERCAQHRLAPVTARLERLRRTLCTARPGPTIDSDLSADWFDATSAHIDALWQLQVALVERLRQDCAARVLEAEQDLQDSAGLLRSLRDNPPGRTQDVDRFFAGALGAPDAAPGALHALLQAQEARAAAMATELETARRALAERRLVERAKALLMARLGLAEDVAFRTLQKASMDENRRLASVAQSVLAAPELEIARLAPPRAKPAR